MFSDYEQEAHARYRIESMYGTAHKVRMARMFAREDKPRQVRGHRFWERVAHGFRQTASPA